MKYQEAVDMLDFLERRFRAGGLNPSWYKWGVCITWEKIERWCKMLGYKGSKQSSLREAAEEASNEV